MMAIVLCGIATVLSASGLLLIGVASQVDDAMQIMSELKDNPIKEQ